MHFTRDTIKDNKYIEIGDFTYGAPIIYQWRCGTRLIIGRFCCIGSQVKFYLGGNHRYERISQYPFDNLFSSTCSIPHSYSNGDIVVGNDVWFGSHSSIMSGVTIGDGCTIGASCMVSKSIPPYSVVVGNPLRIVKKRFSDTEIEKLLKIQWWNWPTKVIEKYASLICSKDVDELERVYENRSW